MTETPPVPSPAAESSGTLTGRGPLPVAELHLHIEGTFEPDLVRRLAERNGLPVPPAVAAGADYAFADLQSFLDVYYDNMAVLVTAEDFHDLTRAYLDRARVAGVRRAEIFFDPQTHLERGVAFETVVQGITSALAEEGPGGISGDLILCVLRHLGPDAALEMLELALASGQPFIGLGLDSTELGNPSEGYAPVYARAAEAGLRLVAHAGEEGDPSYVWGALDALHVERIDHGIRSMEDPALVERLRADQIPLTVCPLSNVALKASGPMPEHPLLKMLDAGLVVCVNSDDPAYFGGYVDDNFDAIRRDLGADDATCARLARNSIVASFAEPSEKAALLAEIDAWEAWPS